MFENHYLHIISVIWSLFFFHGQILGDVCLIAFVFCSGEQLSITFLKLQWEEGVNKTLRLVVQVTACEEGCL